MADDMTEFFTEREIEAFNYGDCWQLSLVIHDMTGWRLVGVGVEGQDDKGGYRDWCHIAVLTPDNKVLDINGLQTKEEVLKKWTLSLWKSLRAPVKAELFLSPNPEYNKAIVFGQKSRYKFSKDEINRIAATLLKYYKRASRKALWEKRLRKKPSVV